jgi:REP element-mobilizing transposase RayT
MGQTLVKNYIHIVFSTKQRKPLIRKDIEAELHTYLGGICNRLDCQILKAGGYTDHVHILCMLSKNIPLAKLVEEIKSHSSKWMKTKSPAYKDFYWQNGYGAFSVKPSEVDHVMDYIERQHEHHDTIRFQDEYMAYLEKYGMEYDSRYVWD